MFFRTLAILPVLDGFVASPGRRAGSVGRFLVGPARSTTKFSTVPQRDSCRSR